MDELNLGKVKKKKADIQEAWEPNGATWAE
jgi:hypothetical protein